MITIDQSIALFGWLCLAGGVLFVVTWAGLIRASQSGRFSLFHWDMANWGWCISLMSLGSAGFLLLFGLVVKYTLNGQTPAIFREPEDGGVVIILAGLCGLALWLPWFQYVNRINIRHECWSGLIRIARKARRRQRNRRFLESRT